MKNPEGAVCSVRAILHSLSTGQGYYAHYAYAPQPTEGNGSQATASAGTNVKVHCQLPAANCKLLLPLPLPLPLAQLIIDTFNKPSQSLVETGHQQQCAQRRGNLIGNAFEMLEKRSD